MTLDSHKLKLIFILVIALFAALYMGIAAATAQFETIAWVAGASLLALCIGLGRNIWILIPSAFALGLTLMIPGQPTVMMLAQALFVPFCVVLFLMRKLPWHFRFTELDFWLLILGLCTLQVYARNPVSISLFGGETVGGRPYILVGLAFVTYLLFSNFIVKPDKLRWILRLSIIGGITSFVLSIIGLLLPSVGIWYGAASINPEEGGGGTEGVETTGVDRATRIGFLGSFARNLSLWVSAFKSPIKACFHPLWAPLVFLSLAFAALSGFRNQIVAVGFTYLVGIAYRGGLPGILTSILALLMAVSSLALVNLTHPLPANIQRTLSIFPGTWDPEIKLDAKRSTDWRFEIWKEVMLTDRWIASKWLGDGLGFSAAELAAQQNLSKGAVSISGLGQHQDNILASGDYHSGPIQTIRTIGYAGLLFMLIAQIRLAVHAHRVIMRCRRTEWYPLSLLVGIPLIWYPFFFVFVFGTYQMAMTALLLGGGFVKMLQYNLPLPEYVYKRPKFHTPLALREGQKPQHGVAKTR